MNKIAYPTMRYSTPGHAGHADAILMVSLPAVPGVTVTSDRAETDPKQPVIRGKIKRQPCKVTPYAIVRAAIIDVAEGRA